MPTKKTLYLGKSTAAVWAGEADASYEGATVPPVFHAVTFEHRDLDEWQDIATGKAPGHIYSRSSNPTAQVLEEKVKALEGAEACISFASGMAAISSTFFSLLAPGKRVVSVKDTYGGTSKIFLDYLPAYNVQVKLCDTTDHDSIEKEIGKGCDILYLETPSNPTLKVIDIARLAAAAKKSGALVVTDNTFATPINQSPLKLGADLVVHSATKYLCGHSDAMGGVLCGRADLVEKVYRFREVNGASLSPDAAYLIARGIKTLELRLERQNASAMKIAQFLKSHPKVSDVFYPGLESHPGYEIARRQMSGYGGMMSFALKGGYDEVKKFLTSLELAHLAASLGSVSTLAGPPRTTSHVELSTEQRQSLGIPESLIRYSVGIENIDDLVADLSQALARV